MLSVREYSRIGMEFYREGTKNRPQLINTWSEKGFEKKKRVRHGGVHQ